MNNLNEFNYSEHIEANGVTLVDFWAAWCGPCRMMEPVLTQLENEGIKVNKVNIDQESMLAARHRIQSIPTIIVYKDKQEKGRIVGAMPLAQLKQEIAKLTS